MASESKMGEGEIAKQVTGGTPPLLSMTGNTNHCPGRAAASVDMADRKEGHVS